MAATNLFTYNQSTAELGITGFTAVASTVTQNATQFWEESHSIKTVTDGGGGFQGIEVFIPVSSFLVNTQYTFSCYFFIAGTGPTVRFYCQTNSGSIGGSPSITLTGGSVWERHSFTVTMPASFTGITQIGLRWDTGSVNQALTMWNDGLQCEQAASASAFVLGTSRVIPASTALLATSSRSIPGSGALLATASRSVPQSSALLATKTRTIPESAALQATANRSIALSAAMLLASSRSIGATAALINTIAHGATATLSDGLVSTATMTDAPLYTATISDTQEVN